MARFTIYSPNGNAIYEGTPTFTGQYMKPGLLEFREVAMPSLVDLVPGCYVDYTRTGHRYRIYTVPQLKKQARSNSYGGAFVYQNVQLYDASKMLEYCPFRDLVAGDNRIHFSTQPSISTFEGCDGLARRFEACLQDQYGASSWRVRVTTQEENPDLYELMHEPREFTVSGLNILECLDKIYEIWPEVGWVYKVETVNGNPVDTIIIGGGGLNPNEGTYAYGKGYGLTSITKTAANAEEIANRIYAYGSSRNMTLPSWYRNQTIKDADSVDIQNLMIPISSWGLTDGERDAAKAYVEDSTSIAKNGLRPTTVYFDGKGEYPEIYPTIRETTIGMVRTALGSSSAKYYPSTSVYTNPNDRIDRLLSAPTSFDSGKAGDDGKQSTFSEYISVSDSDSQTVSADTQRITQTIITEAVTFGSSEEGVRNISIPVSLSGYVQIPGITGARVFAHLHKDHPANAAVVSRQMELPEDSVNSNRYDFLPISLSGTKVNITEGTYYIVVDLEVDLTASESELTFAYSYEGSISVSLSNYREKTFTVSLRQVGFDIGEQANLGNGKTIAMRSGDCVGRAFAINSVQYDPTTDSWVLECWRTEDESLSQWFPNSQFGVAAGDEFVLLDIAMPDIYIAMASQKLLTAAQDLLADTAVERWQYTPEIDAKFMVENGRTIQAGEYMSILGIGATDITPGVVSYFKTSEGGYLLTADGEKIVVSVSEGSVETVFVDTVVINDGEAAIPTYKVTLRDRKKKVWTESQSPDSPSYKSVGSITDSTQQSSGGGDSFFKLDEQGNVTLKPAYKNLWVPGWLAAGGIGDGSEGGGGGGGGTDLAAVWASLTNTPPVDEYVNTKIDISHIPLSDLDTWVSGKGYLTSSDLTSILSRLSTLEDESFFRLVDGNVTLKLQYQNLWVPGWLAAGGVGSGSGGGGGTNLEAVWASLTNSVTDPYANTKIDIAHIPLDDLNTWVAAKGYLTTETDPTVPAWAKQTTPNLFIGTTRVQQSETPQALTGILSINATSLLDSGSRIVWESGNNAWHFYGNLYADGWVAAGGIGSGGGSYTAGTGIDITNNVISLLTASTSVLGGVKVDGTTITISNGVISAVGGGGGATYTAGYGISISSNKTISLKAASENEIGGLRVKVPSSDPSSINAISTTSGKYYYIQRTSGGTAFVNVPWESGGGGGGTVTSVGMTVPTGLSVSPSTITTSGTFAVTLASGYSIPTTAKQGNWDTAYGWGNHATAGYAQASALNNYVTLHTTQTIDGEKTFTTNPINIGTGSGLSMVSTSYIEIGDARIEYDSGSYALRVTKKNGTSRTIGFYADGFVAAGGTAASSSRNIVYTDGDQTITGTKTFSGPINGLTITKSTNYVSLNNESSYKHLVLGSGNGGVFVGSYSSSATSYKFYVSGGDVRFTDNAYASSWNTTSDRRLKDNITPLSKDEAIEKIMALAPSTWEWKEGVNKGLTAAGFVAQDVESVIPFMVGGHEYKSLAYQMLHAYEVSAIQSHEARIKVLENKILEG